MSGTRGDRECNPSGSNAVDLPQAVGDRGDGYAMVSPDVEDREEESANHRSGDDTADDDADDERIGGQ